MFLQGMNCHTEYFPCKYAHLCLLSFHDANKKAKMALITFSKKVVKYSDVKSTIN